jgi:hypothetical protein
VFSDAFAPALLTATAGATLRFVAHAEDPAGGPVSYDLGPGAPSGARLNGRTGLFAFDTRQLGMAPGDAPRTLPLTITATAANGLSASHEMALVVSAAPAAPNATDAAPPGPPQPGAPAAAPAAAPAGAPADAPAGAPVDAPPAPAATTSTDQSFVSPPPDASEAATAASLSTDGAYADQRSAERSGSSAAGVPTTGGGGKRSSKLDGGAIAGIVIACVVGASLAGLSVLTWRTRRVRTVAERHIRLAEF